MNRGGRYRLSEGDGVKILRIIGTLKEAVAELLSTRYTIVPNEQIEQIPSLAELRFYEQAANILIQGDV